MTKQLSVGIADMKLARQEGELITYALGSCIGIALYDPMIKLGALIHIMLPERGTMTDTNLYKFADSGIKETLRKMSVMGGRNTRMTAKIAGGAKMFELKGSSGIFGNIGQRNIISVKQTLREAGIRLTAEDVGENYARTMVMDITTGKVKIRTFGRSEIVL